jgi:hypothetical protein
MPSEDSRPDRSRLATITLTAIGADDLPSVPEGTAVSFMWKRGEQFYLSEPGEVWDNGVVYWDCASAQTCRFVDGKKKYVKLFVQKVPVGPDGIPADFGRTIAAGFLDLAKYAGKFGAEDDEDELDDEVAVKVCLEPSGVLNLNLRLDRADKNEGAVSEDVSSSSCVTPQVVVDDSNVQSGTVSSSSAFSGSYGSKDDASSRKGSKLERKLREMTRQCEEAKARAFSEASVALQRGIEIENMKRAKNVLLKRLETAEQQLMTMMKQELAMTIQETDKSSATLLGMDAIIQQLADTKVALAEKEFEVMELNGKVKAQDAHIEGLVMHLEAVKDERMREAKIDALGQSTGPRADAVGDTSSTFDEVDTATESTVSQSGEVVLQASETSPTGKENPTSAKSVEIHVSAAAC